MTINYNLNAQAYININLIKGLDWKTSGAGQFYGFSKNTFTEYRNFGPVEIGTTTMNSYAGTSQNLMFNSVLDL
jgi:hypothetical protein